MMYRYLSLLIICLSFGSLFSQPAPAEQVDTTLQRPALPDVMITKRRMDQHERFKNRGKLLTEIESHADIVICL